MNGLIIIKASYKNKDPVFGFLNGILKNLIFDSNQATTGGSLVYTSNVVPVNDNNTFANNKKFSASSAQPKGLIVTIDNDTTTDI